MAEVVLELGQSTEATERQVRKLAETVDRYIGFGATAGAGTKPAAFS